MAVTMYRHPETGAVKYAHGGNDVRVAALEKLGFVEWTAEDVENDAGLAVTFQQVARATVPQEPPALPHLTTPIPPGPTRDTSSTAPQTTMQTAPTGREDVAPLKDK